MKPTSGRIKIKGMDLKKEHLKIKRLLGYLPHSSLLYDHYSPLESTVVAMLAAIYLIFMYAHIEKTMGVVQKIFYIHVSSAWCAFLAFFVTFAYSILYLVKRKRIFDTYAYVSAEIGVFFTTIVLTTGPIWAKSSWNTWWVWEPRLITTLILWFIYMAYIMIRQMDGVWDKKARLAAVFGILGFADVPIVFFAIRW